MTTLLKYFIAPLFFGTSFFLFASSALADSCTPVFPATTCSTSGNVNVQAVVPDTTVTFSGFAPAGSVVFMKETGLIIGSTVTDSSGHFSKTVVGTAGQHTYTIYLIDNQGQSTPEVTLPTVNLMNHLDVPITGINLPPTIQVSKTKIAQGEIATIFGQSSPGSTVNVYVNSIKRFSLTVGSDSKWEISLNGVNIADHSVFYAISSRPNLPDSAKSFTVSLDVLACADQNCNRSSTPTPSTPTATATPGTNATNQPNQHVIYEIGPNLVRLITYTSIFLISALALVIIFLIFLLARKKKYKKDLLEELETKVDQDLTKPNPQEAIHTDFEHTRQHF